MSLGTIVSTSMQKCLQLYVFGANDEGQLGNGRSADKELLPVMATSSMDGLDYWKVRCGAKHTVLLTSDKKVFVSGEIDKQEPFGHLHMENSPSFDRDAHKHQFTHMYDRVSLCATTWQTSAYIREPGDQSLNTSVVYSPHIVPPAYHGDHDPDTPVIFEVPCGVRDLQAGHSHFIALLLDGTVHGWGDNRKGQLGDHLPPHVLKPTKLDVSFSVCGIACGKEFSYFVSDPSLNKQELYGRDKFGIRSNMPRSVSNWASVHATWHAIYLLDNTGHLQAWGKQNNFSLIPPGLPLLQMFSTGSDHVLALTNENNLLSWGNAEHGNCGDVAKMPPLRPGGYFPDTWNTIADIPGRILSVHAGHATSFVVTEVDVTNQ